MFPSRGTGYFLHFVFVDFYAVFRYALVPEAVQHGRGGLLAHLGTTSVPEILRRIDNNDLQAMLVLRAMCYNVAKEIGAMAIALKGKADAILLTGGIAHNKRLTDFIAAHVDFIAPVFVYPGENELEALASSQAGSLT